MAAIDIGTIISPYEGMAANYTVIIAGNPANLSGKITKLTFRVWTVPLENFIVATFQKVNSNTFTARDSQAMGSFGLGIHTDVDCDLDIEAGDYIGYYTSYGSLGRKSGSSGDSWYASGNQTTCVNKAFTSYNKEFYLYGEGAEVEVGWTGKISGVTNPAKIAGVDVANIAKVKGVA